MVCAYFYIKHREREGPLRPVSASMDDFKNMMSWLIMAENIRHETKFACAPDNAQNTY